MLNQITPLILTFNEAANIGRTLQQLRWARDIVVIDSFSEDETMAIISEFPQVRTFQRRFDSHNAQWNFGLRETAIATRWVLALDADYILSEQMALELDGLAPSAEICGYRSNIVYCINGRELRSGIYPPVTVLYRHDRASYRQEGHTQRLVVDGQVETLCSSIFHDDRKPLSHWFQSQARYMRLEAEKLLKSDPATLSTSDRIRRLRLVAPVAIGFYCLVLRGGILDGWAGWFYALQRILAELMLSLYLLEDAISIDRQNAKIARKVQLISVHSRHKRISR